MNEDKLELINDFSNYFEEIYKFPPLTSKIYSYLILDISKEGTTFDELVEVFNASKSSVSNSLNFLSQLDYVEHFTKIDNRRRFYRVASGSIIVRLKRLDRKSTRLNSSHVAISYAVFCLKKKRAN